MKRSAWIGVAAVVVAGGGLTYVAGRFARQEVANIATTAATPKITGSEPAQDAVEVSPVTGVKAAVSVPSGAGVDANTLETGVTLVRTRDGQAVTALRNTSGAGDAVVLKPAAPLELGTQYTFAVNAGLKDTAGVAFQPYAVTFTTAKQFAVTAFPAAFEKVPLTTAKLDRDAFTALAIGPDGLLYAGTFAGMIHRFAIAADGLLAEVAPVPTVLKMNGGPRLITGITFDPHSTVDAPILWVSHGEFAMKNGRPEGANDWSGKISRLTGAKLDQYQDVVVGLPRAYKDHLNFQMAFGPDGALYVSQGSNTSVGADDIKWGYRPERKLTAAVLRLDLSKLELTSSPPPLAGRGGGRGSNVGDATQPQPQNPSPYPLPQGEGGRLRVPLDVKTEEGGKYDPAAKDAPLTLYATGVRSGFHLLFHRNGRLYTGVNGAAGNEGNTPASPDGSVPAIRDIKQTTDDMLLKIEPGVYYGHPNPARGQYVLNGGNPTAGVDPMEVPAYPVGTLPDKHWHAPAYDFGKNYSPNGLIDYHDKTVGGALDGCILVTRYSDGKDVLVLKLDANGDVVETIAGLDGLTGLNAPLELIEEPKTGNLYVAEYAGRQITLLRPIAGGESAHAQVTAVAK